MVGDILIFYRAGLDVSTYLFQLQNILYRNFGIAYYQSSPFGGSQESRFNIWTQFGAKKYPMQSRPQNIDGTTSPLGRLFNIFAVPEYLYKNVLHQQFRKRKAL